MPFKDKEERRKYQQGWYQRKHAGLPTKTRTKLEVLEQVEREKISKKKWKEKRNNLRRQQIIEKFGERCPICNDTYRLQIHRKDGTPHERWMNMNNTEFWLLISSNDFVQLCFNCHKAIHWCMYYLGMKWEDIKKLIIPHNDEKNKYHS